MWEMFINQGKEQHSMIHLHSILQNPILCQTFLQGQLGNVVCKPRKEATELDVCVIVSTSSSMI